MSYFGPKGSMTYYYTVGMLCACGLALNSIGISSYYTFCEAYETVWEVNIYNRARIFRYSHKYTHGTFIKCMFPLALLHHVEVLLNE